MINVLTVVMNECLQIILLFPLVLLWHSGLLFLHDTRPNRKKTINGLLLLSIIGLFAPLLLAAITSFGGNPYSENEGGVFLWFYIVIIPVLVPAYLIIITLKIIFAIYAKTPPKSWYIFGGIYILPITVIAISKLLYPYVHKTSVKGPYDGYDVLAISINPEVPRDKLLLTLSYKYPGGENIKALKYFLIDAKYELLIEDSFDQAISHGSKHLEWIYFS